MTKTPPPALLSSPPAALSADESGAAATAVLEVRGLHFAHPGQPPLFRGWSARVPAGVSLLKGDSGTGKSTLLRLLAGTQPDVAAQLELGGVRFDIDAAAYRNEVYWREPGTEEFDQFSPIDIAQSLRPDPRFDYAGWQRHVEGFGLEPHAHKKLYMLSTGSRRKVWLAAGLASKRRLTLLDEPSSALDAASIAYLMRELEVVSAQKDRAVLVASFEPLEAVSLATVIDLDPPA